MNIPESNHNSNDLGIPYMDTIKKVSQRQRSGKTRLPARPKRKLRSNGLHPGRIDLPRDVFKRLSCARTPKRLPLAKAGSSRPRAERPDEMRIVNGSYISPRPERSRENLRQADAAKR